MHIWKVTMIYNMKMNKWVEYDDPGEWSSECSVGDSD